MPNIELRGSFGVFSDSLARVAAVLSPLTDSEECQ